MKRSEVQASMQALTDAWDSQDAWESQEAEDHFFVHLGCPQKALACIWLVAALEPVAAAAPGKRDAAVSKAAPW